MKLYRGQKKIRQHGVSMLALVFALMISSFGGIFEFDAQAAGQAGDYAYSGTIVNNVNSGDYVGDGTGKFPIQTDKQGNIYVYVGRGPAPVDCSEGQAYVTCQYSYIVVNKFNPAGELIDSIQLVTEYNYDYNYSDAFTQQHTNYYLTVPGAMANRHLDFDDQGNIYIAGEGLANQLDEDSQGSTQESARYAVVKYSPTGGHPELLGQLYNSKTECDSTMNCSPPQISDIGLIGNYGTSVHVGDSGAIYVVGRAGSSTDNGATFDSVLGFKVLADGSAQALPAVTHSGVLWDRLFIGQERGADIFKDEYVVVSLNDDFEFDGIFYNLVRIDLRTGELTPLTKGYFSGGPTFDGQTCEFYTYMSSVSIDDHENLFTSFGGSSGGLHCVDDDTGAESNYLGLKLTRDGNLVTTIGCAAKETCTDDSTADDTFGAAFYDTSVAVTTDGRLFYAIYGNPNNGDVKLKLYRQLVVCPYDLNLWDFDQACVEPDEVTPSAPNTGFTFSAKL